MTGYFDLAILKLPNMHKIEKEWPEAHNKSLANTNVVRKYGWPLISEDWVGLTLFFSFCLQTKDARFPFPADVLYAVYLFY